MCFLLFCVRYEKLPQTWPKLIIQFYFRSWSKLRHFDKIFPRMLQYTNVDCSFIMEKTRIKTHFRFNLHLWVMEHDIWFATFVLCWLYIYWMAIYGPIKYLLSRSNYCLLYSTVAFHEKNIWQGDAPKRRLHLPNGCYIISVAESIFVCNSECIRADQLWKWIDLFRWENLLIMQ